jgi:hypothetical protein
MWLWGGGLTAERRAFREQLRMQAAERFTSGSGGRHATACARRGWPPRRLATSSPTAVEVIRTADRIESDNGRRYRKLVRYRRRSVDDLAGQVTPMFR